MFYCGMYVLLSDDELRFVKKVHTAGANGHCLHGRISNPLLLRYHISQLYFVCDHLIYILRQLPNNSTNKNS